MSGVFKVNIAVHGRWHAFELANGLFRLGALGKLFTTYPKFAARQFVDPGVEIGSKPQLEFHRRLYDKLRIGPRPDLAIAREFAKYAASNAITEADILVGWSSATLEAIAPAKQNGMKVVVERGSTHIAYQERILSQAYEELGLKAQLPSPEIIARELAEYEAADAIAVPTEFAARTFTDQGIPPAKLIVNGYGVDLSRYKPEREENAGAVPRIVFVGRVGVRKGVPWLLKAMKEIGAAAELHLIGPVETGFEDYLQAEKSEGVYVRGALPAQALAAEYNQADIFCLPSIEEGMPLTLLQAQSCALPAVVTEAASGGIIEQSGGGLVITERDSISLADALVRLIEDTPMRRELGDNGRASLEAGYSWQEYAARAYKHYEKLLA
ncbi:MAG: glycosyltransferase family 4 protein [Rhodospirillales bacterium]|nr:glycosyltransferase family 4 protein [Rhodospirillales bacterium]